MNKFEKEYVTGRKDQFDIDYAIFRKAVEETGTREDLIQKEVEKLVIKYWRCWKFSIQIRFISCIRSFALSFAT